MHIYECMADEGMGPIEYTIGTMMLAIILHLLSFLLCFTLSNDLVRVNRINRVRCEQE